MSSRVWITGAGSGLGRALALEYAGRGSRVLLSGRRVARLEEVRERIVEAGGEALVAEADVADRQQLEAAVRLAEETWGGLDVVIANAGCSVSGRLETLEPQQLRRQLEINVVGAFQTAQVALPLLRASEGRLGLMASVSGLICAPKAGAYSASKFALRALGLTWAQELHGSGVSCTVLCPGFVESEIAQVDNEGIYHPDRRDPRPGRLMWTAERAARVMRRALDRRRREYVFTGHGRVAAFFGMHFPGLVHWVITRFGVRR